MCHVEKSRRSFKEDYANSYSKFITTQRNVVKIFNDNYYLVEEYYCYYYEYYS